MEPPDKKTLNIPIAIFNKIVAEANWQSTNGHGGVDDITRDNFIQSASFGYSLAQQEIKERDAEIAALRGFRDHLLNEIERLKGLIHELWKFQFYTLAPS